MCYEDKIDRASVLLFSHALVASGTDLAKLYVDTLNQAEADPEELHFIIISKLYQLMPCVIMWTGLSISLPASRGPTRILGPVSTGDPTVSPVGHPRLHQHIA